MVKRDSTPKKPSPKWFTEFMNNCVVYFEDGLMHGVDITNAVQLCQKDPDNALATLNTFAEMLKNKSRKDKGAEMLAGGLFVSFQLMRHQQSGLPPETIDLSVLPPELMEIRKKHPVIDDAIKHVLDKMKPAEGRR
jgi:hypothetical protein